MLLILNEPTDNLKLFAPGNEIKPFIADGLPDTIPNKMWFWDDKLEYIGDGNQIERATPTLTCSRLVRWSTLIEPSIEAPTLTASHANILDTRDRDHKYFLNSRIIFFIGGLKIRTTRNQTFLNRP